jgi:hypothetical protein
MMMSPIVAEVARLIGSGTAQDAASEQATILLRRKQIADGFWAMSHRGSSDRPCIRSTPTGIL